MAIALLRVRAGLVAVRPGTRGKRHLRLAARRSRSQTAARRSRNAYPARGNEPERDIPRVARGFRNVVVASEPERDNPRMAPQLRNVVVARQGGRPGDPGKHDVRRCDRRAP